MTFVFGLVVGGIVGFFTACILIASTCNEEG